MCQKKLASRFCLQVQKRHTAKMQKICNSILPPDAASQKDAKNMQLDLPPNAADQKDAKNMQNTCNKKKTRKMQKNAKHTVFGGFGWCKAAAQAWRRKTAKKKK